MKKITTIFLLLQFLTNNTFAEEFAKLPKLFTHFYHHTHEHKDVVDFGDFITKHYFDAHKESEHQGEDKDCDLPFKHCDDCCVNAHAPIMAFIPQVIDAKFDVIIISAKKYSFQNEKIKSICSPPIWQPPKVS